MDCCFDDVMDLLVGLFIYDWLCFVGVFGDDMSLFDFEDMLGMWGVRFV